MDMEDFIAAKPSLATFGERLEYEISRMEITHREFAKRCGLCHTQVSHFIHNVKRPALPTMERIINVFDDAHGVDANWLITGRIKF